MSAPGRGSEERYAEIVAALVGLPNVSQSMQKGFGSSGLAIDGKAGLAGSGA
jgi:hypothetical protein